MSHPVRGKRATQADAVDNLLWQIKHFAPGLAEESDRLPVPEREYQFHSTRLWRFDLCWPLKMLAVEIDGGIYQYGRHNRAESMLKDMEKMNEAALLGYRVLHFIPQDVITDSGRTVLTAFETIARAFRRRP